jgi:uncharacterized protein (TIGR04255 family)
MTATALGTWRRPPLAYVVAELVISPYYSMSTKVPDLQDRLRASFPKTIEAQEIVFDGGKAAPQSLWQLISADQKHGVLLGTRAISLHATSYVNSADLLNRWADVLDAIRGAGLGAFVERAGLRYADVIVPEGDGSPTKYVASQLQGVTPEGAQPTGSIWAAAYQFDGCNVNLRVGAPSPAGVLLPPNFSTMPLNKPSVMVEAEKRVKQEKAIGFIDTDCSRELNQVFDAGALVGVYTDMQKLTSRTFRAALSELAQKEWI